MRVYVNDKERCKAWRKSHPGYMQYKRATLHYKMNAWRRKAIERNLEFTITDKDVDSLPLVCGYSGIPLTMEVGCDNSVSLDRINNDKGYIPGNIVLCIRWVNVMKQNKSVSEFADMCRKIVECIERNKISS